MVNRMTITGRLPALNEGTLWKNYQKFYFGLYRIFTQTENPDVKSVKIERPLEEERPLGGDLDSVRDSL